MYTKYNLKTKKIKTNKNKKKKLKQIKTRKTKKMLGGEITISDANDFGLNLFNTINGKIYQIKINDCFFYFSVNDSVKYLLLELGAEYHILKLDESIPDLTVVELNEIKGIINSNLLQIQKYNILLDKNIRKYKPYVCHKSYDLKVAKNKIQELNILLKEKCTNLTLQLDYVYNMDIPILVNNVSNNTTALLLCLNNNEGCISSIVISIYETYIIISSDTLLRYENKKYNKLLRCVVVIISKLLSVSLQNVISHACNTISAYLFMKLGGRIPHDHDEINEPFFTFLNEKKIDLNSETDYRKLFDIYKEYKESMNDNFELTVYIPITPENIENAGIIFNKILDNEIIC
jgi:hypothetical protein